MFMVLSSWHSHCESSPGSFDECRLSTGWPRTLRPNQLIWAVSPLIGCYHPQTPSPFIIMSQLQHPFICLCQHTVFFSGCPCDCTCMHPYSCTKSLLARSRGNFTKFTTLVQFGTKMNRIWFWGRRSRSQQDKCTFPAEAYWSTVCHS